MINMINDRCQDKEAASADARPRCMDWLARMIAWSTMAAPRVAPSRWSQQSRHRQASDLPSVLFTTEADDGVKLESWYFPPMPIESHEANESNGSAGATESDHAGQAGRQRRPTVFFAHGWTETKEFHVRLARVLTAAGYPAVFFDQRGHGRSEGACTLGVREADDLRAVIDQSTRRGYAGEQVLTMGVSMGAAAVLRHAARDPRVIAAVSFAPFTSFIGAVRSYARRYVPWLSAEWGVRGFIQSSARRGFDICEAKPIDVINDLNIPVLFVVGARDINLPGAEHARMLYAAARPGMARIIEVPDATHFNICMSKWPGLDEEVLAFLNAASARLDAAT